MEADPDLVNRCLHAYWLSTDASIDDKTRMQAVLSVVAAHLRHRTSNHHLADQLMQEAGLVQLEPETSAPMPVTITDPQ